MRVDILIVPAAETYGTPELRIQRIADFRRRLPRFGMIVDMRGSPVILPISLVVTAALQMH